MKLLPRHRFKLLRLLTLLIALPLVSLAQTPAAAAEEAPSPSVLMIVVDDLRDTVGFLENFSGVPTPNLDRLSARGATFTNAHCAAPACGPSRTAVFSGLRPSTTGVYENGQSWPEELQDHVTLTREFMLNGYYVAGSGKNYHGQGYLPNWHAYFNVPWDQDYGTFGEPMGKPLDVPFEETRDAQRVQWMIDRIAQDPDTPAFFSVGIVKPHLPFNVPRKYFEMFPLEGIQLPDTIDGDLDDVPEIARFIALGLDEQDGRLKHSHVLEHDLWRKNIQAYLACVAYVDDLVGQLLDAWDASSHSKNGIIVLWGDHGWHLGEKEHWSKFTLWNTATRVPFVIVAPGVTEPDQHIDAPVNLVDIFPTLLGLTGLPARRDLEGNNLTPLLRDPDLRWDAGSVTFHGYGNKSVHSGKWHAIYYNIPGERELYDLEADPNEFNNLADQYDTNPEIRAVLDSLYYENLRFPERQPAPFGAGRQSFFDAIPE